MSILGKSNWVGKTLSAIGALSAIAVLGVPKSGEAIVREPSLSPSAVIVREPSLPAPCQFCGYTSEDLHARFGPAELSNIIHTGFNSIRVIPDGDDEIEVFESALLGVVAVNGREVEMNLPGTVTTTVFGKNGRTTGEFDTEISFLHEGNIMGMDVMIRESLERTSGGFTSIEELSNGNFAIESFFNVFVELSLDGGRSWIADSANPNGVRVVLQDTQDTIPSTRKVPEPATAIASLVVGLSGLGVLKKKRLSQKR